MTPPIINPFGTRLIFILLIWGSTLVFELFGQPSNSLDVCNFETFTKSCSFFNPEGPEKIELKNGTSFPNVVVLSRQLKDEKFQASLQKRAGNQIKTKPEFLRVRQRLINLLNEIPDERMHPTFKYYFTENFIELTEAIFNKENTLSNQIEIPWPMEKPEGPKLIAKTEVIRRISMSLARNQSVELERLYEEMKSFQSIPARSVASSLLEEANRRVTPEREKYVSSLVEFSKLRIKSLIAHRKNEKELNDAELNIIRKVNTVKLNPLRKESAITGKQCIGNLPNAFYNSSDHSITFCPSVYLLPDPGVLHVISHELAHSIAPCISQFGTYEINSNNLVKSGQSLAGGVSREIMKDPNKRELVEHLIEINEKSNITASPLGLLSSEEAIKYFIDKKVLKPEIPGVKPDRYPFRQVVECLISKQGFRNFGESEIRNLATNVVKGRTLYREVGYDPKSDERQIVDAFMKFPGCVDMDNHGQLDEAFSDWVASKVLGDYLTGNSLSSDEEKLGMVAGLAGEVCLLRYEASRKKLSTVLDVLAEAHKDSHILEDSHPSAKMRLEKILLAEPNVRQALGCPPQRNLACER